MTWQLELMIADTKAEIEKHKGQGVSTDTQQKRTLRMQVRVCGVRQGRRGQRRKARRVVMPDGAMWCCGWGVCRRSA